MSETPRSMEASVRDIRVPVGRDRFVMLHYHIFKNGGSTIDDALHRSFGERFANFHGLHDDARLFAHDVEALIAGDASISALSSHHLRYPRPEMRDVVFYDVCFLRHPLGRIRSLYRYGRRIDPASWLGALAQRLSEAAFVAHLLEEMPHAICEVQTNFLANASAFMRPAGERDLDIACALIRQAAVSGVVEMFDESLAAAEYFVRPAFPEISLAYVARNVSAPEGHRPEESAQAIHDACRTAWGTELCDAVARLNDCDLRLYAVAREEIGRRFALLPQAATRLAEFRARCRALQALE